MTAKACAIWKTPAQLLESAGDFEVFDSPRTGGKYWISGSAVGQVLPLNDHAKRLLTTWICEQRRAGMEIPKISQSVLDLVKSRQRLPVTERLTAALLFLGRNIRDLGDRVSVGAEGEVDTLRCMAETESNGINEMSELFTMLHDTGYIQGSFSLGGHVEVCPTTAGWQEIDRLNRPKNDSSQAFVAMWFSPATNDAYSFGIEPALNASGYKAVRIDKKEHNNKIDDEIIAEIRRSRFLIADFTCESKSVRGGVYYEAGFAQGLGIPVIWTCKDTSLADLHFDTRQFAHIVWRDAADLFVQLKNRIGATMGDGPLPKA
jgi:nucleoside 2-deoxyribosyltransferase